MKKLIAGIATLVAVVCVFSATQVDGQDKAKYSIKEVMKKAMGKDGLCGKVAGGTATDAEKAQLIELFDALHKNMPPKGGDESWKTKTTALLEAAKKGDKHALKAAANCKACHSEHKGK